MESTRIDKDTITYHVTQYHNHIIVLASQTASHHNLTENKLVEPSLVLNFQSCLPWFSSLKVWAFTPMPPLALTTTAVTKTKIVAWAAASSKALALVANRIHVLQVKRENTNSCQTNRKLRKNRQSDFVSACILFESLIFYVPESGMWFWNDFSPRKILEC